EVHREIAWLHGREIIDLDARIDDGEILRRDLNSAFAWNPCDSLIVSEKSPWETLKIIQKDLPRWGTDCDVAYDPNLKGLGSYERGICHEDISTRTGQFDITGISYD